MACDRRQPTFQTQKSFDCPLTASDNYKQRAATVRSCRLRRRIAEMLGEFEIEEGRDERDERDARARSAGRKRKIYPKR